MAIDVTVSMETITCCHEGCGIVFAVPAWWENKRREDKTYWYCPNGHSQHFLGKALKDQLEEARQSAVSARLRAEAAERDAQAKASLLAGERTKLRKMRKRVAAGVCPAGCQRHFTNLQRHIASKHPGYAGKKAVTA